MGTSLTRVLAAIVTWIAGLLAAVEEPGEVQVYCPAVAFDDYDERGKDVPMSPARVVLTVVAKVAWPQSIVESRNSPKSAADSTEARREAIRREGVELIVERVLFGSPPGARIHVAGEIGTYVPEDADRQAYIFSVTMAARSSTSQPSRPQPSQPQYSLNGYYSYDRIYPLDDEPYVRALSQARLDLHVLSAAGVVVAKPVEPSRDGGAREAVVERVLHGPFKVGQRIDAGSRERRLLPLAGPGPFVYLLDSGRAVDARWSLETLEDVTKSLARRGDYAVRHSTDAEGKVTRSQEITLAGPRSTAIAMLSSPKKTFEILAARRLLAEAAAAESDVVAAIESDLWSDRQGPHAFRRQMNLIRLLGFLEHHRPDGHVARLIRAILTKAEAGADFPGRFEVSDLEARLRATGYKDELSVDSNHSLGWLLSTLDKADAARLFAERIVKLRDLAPYGWKDEVQFVLDHRKLEDELALARVEPLSRNVTPVRWAVEIDRQPAALDFPDNESLCLRSADGAAAWYRIANGAARAPSATERRIPATFDDPRDRAYASSFVAEDNRNWEFIGQDGGKYHRFRSFEIRVSAPGVKPDALGSPDPRDRVLGVVKTKWGQYRWLGLVPGGEYFHIGTQVFRRLDLQPVSAVNVSGAIEWIQFAPNGRRYVVVTADDDPRPNRTPTDSQERSTPVARVRVHDTITGATLFVVRSTEHVGSVALSPDRAHLAILNSGKSIEVWPLPRE